MATYTAITDVETDPEAPLTSELAKKWRDNPIAITELATGAPRIKRKRYTANDATLTITDLNGFHGFSWSAAVSYSSGNLNGVRIELSTDGGSTWGAAQSFGAIDARDTLNNAFSVGYVDLLTGTYFGHGIRASVPALVRESGTLSGASESVNAIRFTESSGAVSWSLVVDLDGGGGA